VPANLRCLERVRRPLVPDRLSHGDLEEEYVMRGVTRESALPVSWAGVDAKTWKSVGGSGYKEEEGGGVGQRDAFEGIFWAAPPPLTTSTPQNLGLVNTSSSGCPPL